jgi:hypothetical protein
VITNKDARGKTVGEGDTVIDKRGRAWVIISTEATLRKQRLVRARRIFHSKEYFSVIDPRRTFRVRKSSSSKQANARRWKEFYKKYARPLNRATARRRRIAEALPLRPCPVCQNGAQPCKFKIGLAVWRGKRLRVCSTSCAHTVKNEVRRERHEQPSIDPERVRKTVAFRFMQKGGQE